ncbi:MAG: hypothetical protein HPY76_07305 [Anaerolineae bacterium]|nr:hypothetical protein [Anaerolineae bacterium]
MTDKDNLVLMEVPEPPEAILDGVADGTWLPPEPYRRLVQFAARNPLQAVQSGDVIILNVAGGNGANDPNQPGMTQRQRQMLQFLAMGMDNRQIARRLGISYRTVVYHMGSLKKYLGVRSRKGILVAAARRGLVPLRKSR